MTFEEFKEQTQCTVTENNKILINPEDKNSFTAYPLDLEKPTVEVTLEEYIGFVFGLYEFNDDLTAIVRKVKKEDNTEN